MDPVSSLQETFVNARHVTETNTPSQHVTRVSAAVAVRHEIQLFRFFDVLDVGRRRGFKNRREN